MSYALKQYLSILATCIIMPLYGNVTQQEAGCLPRYTIITEEHPLTITVRCYTADDYEYIMAIVQENAYWLFGDQGVAKQLQNPGTYKLVCEMNGTIAGFIMYDIAVTEEQSFGGIRYMAVACSSRFGGLRVYFITRSNQASRILWNAGYSSVG